MKKYVVVDAGKGGTKVALYTEKDGIKTFEYQTKFSAGDFCDDALENNTFLAKIDGETYKVGNGALTKAEIQTTKMTPIHKISTLTALALCASDDEIDDMDVVVGCPLSEYAIPAKRKEYMDYVLEEGEHTVEIKTKSDADPVIRKFNVTFRKVLPETAGIFFTMLDDYEGEPIGVIDIGNVTAIGAVYDDFEIDHNFDFTDMRGGAMLISLLSQKLTARFSKYNQKYTLKLLLRPANERFLENKNIPGIEEDSKKLIHDEIISYLHGVRELCNAAQWSLDYMKLVFGGGTAHMLQDEIKEVFGDNVVFAPYEKMANAIGSLRRLVQLRTGKDIFNKKK